MDTEKWIDSKNGIVDLEFEESDKISKNFSVPLIKDEDIKQEKSTPDELDFGVYLLENSNADYEVKIEEDEPVTKKQKFEENTDFTDKMLENGDPNVAVKLEIQETPKMSGHHGYQSVTQKLALQKFAIENPTPGMYLQDYAKFVGVFRECWERSMPCFQTVEYGILYCYESTSFGSDVINMECSSKFKGCNAKLTAIPQPTITKKIIITKFDKQTTTMRFINPRSEQNYILKNYKTKNPDRIFHHRMDFHTCFGLIEEQKIRHSPKISDVIYISKNPSSIYPAMYAIENDITYEYFGSALGEEIIHLRCSNHKKGCKTKTTIEHLNNIVITSKSFPKYQWNENYSEKNYKMENYDMGTFKRNNMLESHNCKGFDSENPIFKDSERDKFLRDYSLIKLIND